MQHIILLFFAAVTIIIIKKGKLGWSHKKLANHEWLTIERDLHLLITLRFRLKLWMWRKTSYRQLVTQMLQSIIIFPFYCIRHPPRQFYYRERYGSPFSQVVQKMYQLYLYVRVVNAWGNPSKFGPLFRRHNLWS